MQNRGNIRHYLANIIIHATFTLEFFNMSEEEFDEEHITDGTKFRSNMWEHVDQLEKNLERFKKELI